MHYVLYVNHTSNIVRGRTTVTATVGIVVVVVVALSLRVLSFCCCCCPSVLLVSVIWRWVSLRVLLSSKRIVFAECWFVALGEYGVWVILLCALNECAKLNADMLHARTHHNIHVMHPGVQSLVLFSPGAQASLSSVLVLDGVDVLLCSLSLSI